MSSNSLNSILVVGVNPRPIVKSAKALGLKTIAVGCFCDLDLLSCADDVFSKRTLDFEGVPPSLFELCLQALEVHEVDAIILASSTEHDPRFVKELSKHAEIIGNTTIHLEMCEKKERLFRIADELDIPHPFTKRVETLYDALKAAENIGYPVVLKPAFGGGGIGIKLAGSPEELERLYGRVLSAGDSETLYVQQFIRGVDGSASILSNGDEARCLTVNEQIIGDKRLGAPMPFGYCGNMIPLEHEFAGKIAEYSQMLCIEMGLVGSNGVDFVLSDRPYLMEINPRFQSTIDCVEGLLGINLVKEHIRACRGELGRYEKPKGCSVKLILYATRDVRIPDLTKIPHIVDVPPQGSVVRKGHPICSVLKFGESRRKVITNGYALAGRISELAHRQVHQEDIYIRSSRGFRQNRKSGQGCEKCR